MVCREHWSKIRKHFFGRLFFLVLSFLILTLLVTDCSVACTELPKCFFICLKKFVVSSRAACSVDLNIVVLSKFKYYSFVHWPLCLFQNVIKSLPLLFVLELPVYSAKRFVTLSVSSSPYQHYHYLTCQNHHQHWNKSLH